MTEEWRAIPGWEGFYEVSDQGRVRSLDREFRQRCNGGKVVTKRLAGRLLAAGNDTKGYPVVSLSRDGKAHRIFVHTLMLTTFVRPATPGEIADHKDGVRNHNQLGNLRWVSYRANARNRHNPRNENPYVGVDYRGNRKSPWRAKSTDRNGRSKHIGYFATAEQAREAYLDFKKVNFDD